ncbi:PaaI family thioesterase [Calidifontibacillus erzurumensis]|uniref:PaaI family thioesterase n=1 Tax=Calidifontibacillus erzurumensis TaxID=2741433 RepID=A0A8J8KAF7_9BACI|nr:hotdog domain-containing protein [Calidifontibacillus erzurumensis]NSL50587.1 PaaI family thioesterase [Calidifontibacillus erzurumensis]
MKIFQPQDLVEVATKGKIPPNCDITLQLTPTVAENGVARGVWKVDEKFINGNGVVMGGYLAAAADTMMAYAIASKLSKGLVFTTIDLHTTFHRPATIGEIEVEARVERMGKRVAYLVADVIQNEKKVVSAVSSVMILEKQD